MSTRVSLVMPAWNPRLDWLRTAVSSALAQTGVEVELVVVDDGSDEPLGDRLAEFDDPRVKLIRVPHGGSARARNAGTRATTGDWVRFVDGDDYYDPHGCEHLLALAGSGRVISYGATLVCDAGLSPRWLMRTSVQGDARVATLLSRFSVRPFALLFPREVVELTGDWDPSLPPSEDWDYILRAVEHATVHGDHRVVARYRRHGTSQTTNIEGGRAAARRVMDRYFERHPEERGSDVERRARAMLWAGDARVYATHGRPGAAVHAAARAVMTSPASLFGEAEQIANALRGKLRRPVIEPPLEP